jgi:quinol monooxygenase YgiN
MEQMMMMGFLLFEVFSNQEAHQLHSQGNDLQKFLQSMQEQNMRMEVMMMGGEELESESQTILN